YCICFMLFLESLLFLGFIQSNNHYLELFNCSSIPAMILDSTYHEVTRTSTYQSEEGILKLKDKINDFINEEGIRLSYAPITHGYVLWEEDVSQLIEVNKQLASIQLDLQEQHSSELEAYKAEQLHQRLTQRNRLFDLLLAESHEKIEELEKLVNQLEQANQQEEEPILLRLAVIGAYIKRRYNLSFLALDHKRIASKELQLCIQQSLACLKLFKITTYLDFNLTKELAMHELIELFEIYEEVIEKALEGIEELYVNVKETDESILMHLRICTKSPLNALKEVEVVQEDKNDWLISYRLMKGDTYHE
ncbi:MAG: hypothetical protein HUJ56_11530, partial [Erysipelotrichaceae bacterium]|nr:hypothetical protein [Erysipelotrichaceae bacterium]